MNMGQQGTEVSIGQAKLTAIHGDITQQDTDAIVNAANPGLMGGGGVDGAIHRAGGPVILEECKQIISRQGRLPTGQAVLTGGGNLKARFVIHTVGPIYRGGNRGEARLLESAVTSALKVADELKLRSVSLPSISTGIFGYPLEPAIKVIVKAIFDFLAGESALEEVHLVEYDLDKAEEIKGIITGAFPA